MFQDSEYDKQNCAGDHERRSGRNQQREDDQRDQLQIDVRADQHADPYLSRGIILLAFRILRNRGDVEREDSGDRKRHQQPPVQQPYRPRLSDRNRETAADVESAAAAHGDDGLRPVVDHDRRHQQIRRRAPFGRKMREIREQGDEREQDEPGDLRGLHRDLAVGDRTSLVRLRTDNVVVDESEHVDQNGNPRRAGDQSRNVSVDREGRRRDANEHVAGHRRQINDTKQL